MKFRCENIKSNDKDILNDENIDNDFYTELQKLKKYL